MMLAGRRLDTFRDQSDDLVLITYQVADIREIDRRTASTSKTCTLPSTPNNDEIFSYLFQVSVDSTFDLNRKAPVSVEADGVEVFRGYLKLDAVRTGRGGRSEYDVTLYSQVADLMADIGQKRVSEYDFSDWDHQYTRDVVVGSWDTFVVYKGVRTGFSPGRGYVYPYVDFSVGREPIITLPNGQQRDVRSVEFFRPHPYLKTVLDGIMRGEGYTYESEFLDSDYFRSLVITPNLKGTYNTDEELEALRFLARPYRDPLSTPSGNPAVGSQGFAVNTGYGQPHPQGTFGWDGVGSFPTLEKYVTFRDDVVRDGLDNGGNFDPDASVYGFPCAVYTMPIKYQQSHRITVDLGLYWQYFDALLGTPVTLGSGPVRLGNNNGDGMSVRLQLCRRDPASGVIDIIDDSIIQEDVDYTTTGSGGPVQYWSEQVWTNTMYIDVDDEISPEGAELFLRVYSSAEVTQLMNASAGACLVLYMKETSEWYNEPQNVPLYESNDVIFNRIMPDMPAKDFFMSVVRMFNLYVDVSPDDDRRLLIEPRDSFYTTKSGIDWTRRMDRGSEVLITPMSEINSSRMTLTYKQDRDRWNQDYERNTGRTYGDYPFDLGNDFLTGREQRMEVGFAPTPLVGEDTSDRVISRIWLDTPGQTYYDDCTTRVLFYGGMLPCDAWVLRSAAAGDEVVNAYPYAGHLDDPRDPGDDLNFFQPTYYYFRRTGVTANNLFGRFWTNTVEDLYSPDARIILAWFDLSVEDIRDFDFRDLVFLDDAYYYVNRIIDFNPARPQLTRVELVRANNPGRAVWWRRPPSGKPVGNGVIKPGTGQIDRPLPPGPLDGTNVGVVKPLRPSDGNLRKDQHAVVGMGNSVGTPNPALVVGNGNVIGGRADGTVLMGSNISAYGAEPSYVIGGRNVRVSPAAAGAVVVGASDVVVSQPGVLYLTEYVKLVQGTFVNNADVVRGGVDAVQVGGGPFEQNVVDPNADPAGSSSVVVRANDSPY